MKLDPADIKFSQYVRKTQGKCQRCGSPVEFNAKGLPVSHNVSHYFGRGRESTRFSLENCDTLCFGCHQEWGGEDHEAYRQFKIKQLGEEGFKRLRVQAETFKKRDRRLEAIKWREALKE